MCPSSETHTKNSATVANELDNLSVSTKTAPLARERWLVGIFLSRILLPPTFLVEWVSTVTHGVDHLILERLLTVSALPLQNMV
jgi:hypothetical protein